MSLLDNLLSLVKEGSASDLHLGEGYRPFLRINGGLVEDEERETLEKKDVDEIAQTLLSGAQIEKLTARKDVDFSFAHGDDLRFRGHAYYVGGKLNFAFRSLPVEIPSLESLGISEDLVERFLKEPEGLFLVTGPTGCGKSTTIASMIDALNSRHAYHIVTIEDPVEYVYKNKKSLVKQREVGKDEGDVKNFSKALRSALREDPDIIFVGEMRDAATIQLALRAAETGHLVFSTLHAAYASQIPNRIINAFPSAQHQQIRNQLAYALRGAISQRLLPKKDGTGRVAAFEILFTNDAVRNLIQEGKLQGIRDVMKTSRADGMILLEDALAELESKGLI